MSRGSDDVVSEALRLICASVYETDPARSARVIGYATADIARHLGIDLDTVDLDVPESRQLIENHLRRVEQVLAEVPA